MNNLPKGWTAVTFKDVAEVNPRKFVDLALEDIVTFVPMASVDEISGTIKTPTVRPLKEVNKGFTQFVENDVIFAKITPSMENGKSAVAKDLANGIGFGSTEFHVFRSRGAVLPAYLWRYVRQREFREKAQQVMSGAVGQQRVPAEYLRECPLPLPPLAEQQRIVTKIDNLIARTTNAHLHLDCIPTLIASYKQRILTMAFSGHLTAAWREKSLRSSEWSSKSLGELITEIVAGKNLKCEERPPMNDEKGVVKVSAVTWGNFNPREAKTLPSNFIPAEKTRINKGDFLISRANTLELVGAVVIVKDEPSNLFLSDKILRLEMAETEKPWLLWFLRSPQGRAAIESRASGNQISMRNLSQRNLLEIKTPWPSDDERLEIIRRIEAEFEWLDRISTEYYTAAQMLPKLDDAILTKAFCGRLVSQSSSDEHASALLERINAQWAEKLITNKDQKLKQRKVQIQEEDMALEKSLEHVLIEANDWLPAKTAFQNCGVGNGSSTEEIERVYAELRDLDVAGKLESETVTDSQGRKVYDRIRLKVE
ncbi:TPA: restriction endonuclease subunit S [Klebsiella variicola]